LAELSDGEILLIGLITQIITSTQDIIFFEELENSIHPKALESLIGLMTVSHNDKQVLISTHSATLLNMVKPENVFVSVINDRSYAEITMIQDLKEMKRKLSKGFINFGDLLYQNDSNKFEDIFE
jgi:predicted ATPase